MSYPRLAMKLYDRPLLITPEKAQIIEAVFRAHEEGRAALLSPVTDSQPRAELAAPGLTRTDAGYYRTADGVALIPVIGTLVQRGDSMDALSGLMSYQRIGALLQAALDDARSDAILLEIDSSGGEANGLIDLAGKVRAASAKKPVWALANEQAFSAAYWLAASAGRVLTPNSGMVGSVGVVMLHVDQSQRDAKQGLVYTPVFAGDHKVDFSAHAPLSDDARAIAQDEVDRLYGLFVSAIADYRGIDPQAVMDTQARILNPEDAQQIGFIDGIASLDETLSALGAEAKQFRYRGMRAAAAALLEEDIGDREVSVHAPNGAHEENAMATIDPKVIITADDLAQAQARGFQDGQTQARAEHEKALQDARADAAKASQERIGGILGHAEAQGRRVLAEHIAFNTTSSVDEAAALLAAAPKEAASMSLASRMAAVPNPKLGAGAEVPDGARARTINAREIFARRSAAAQAK